VHRIGRTGRAGRAGTAITLIDPREHRHLRTIERTTGQTIEIATVPTVSDLKARRLEKTASDLRELLSTGGFEDARTTVSGLTAEFDVLDIAAAAITLADRATSGTADAVEITAAVPVSGPSQGRDSRDRAPRGGASGGSRIFFGAGRKAGIRPADLVGAITGEAGLPSRSVRVVQIAEAFSVVEVPEEEVDAVIAAVGPAGLRGKRVTVRRDRH
jgi:ATP-dependent RNA helicase DeaD